VTPLGRAIAKARGEKPTPENYPKTGRVGGEWSVDWYGNENEYDGPRRVTLKVCGVEVEMTPVQARRLARALQGATK
jgi:hypothetical protein